MVTPETWRMPSPEEQILANQGYIKYAVGLTMLLFPDNIPDAVGMSEGVISEPDDVLIHAEGLMLAGLKDVVRYANPPEFRIPLSLAEPRHLSALGHMRTTLNNVYGRNREQLHELSPSFNAVRPLPVLDRVTYGYVSRSRTDKLRTTVLMGGFMPHKSLADAIARRAGKRWHPRAS